MADFESMPAGTLAIWRDHLVDSFTPGSSYSRKFRFLRKDGIPPKLTMLKLGSSAAKNNKGKGDTAVKKGKSGAKHGRPRKVKAIPSHNKMSVHDSDGSEIISEKPAKKKGRGGKGKAISKADVPDSSDDGNARDVPSRPRSSRTAAISSAQRIRRAAELEKSDGSSPETRAIEKSAPPARKPLPGSADGRIIAAERSATRILAKSPYLQTRGMGGGTLPIAWSRQAFDPSKVSSA